MPYYGRNICASLDLSDKFENAPTQAQLESLALTMMQSRQTQMPAQSIKVDFVRLQDMGYEGLDNLLQCNLCDTIKVEFPRYNMSGSFKIVRTVYDVLQDKYESMELGALSTSLADALGITNSLGGSSGGGGGSETLWLWELNTDAPAGTVDGDLYRAIVALGWEDEVIEDV